ncbi:MAG: DUF1015 domain-containing protein [Micropruina sp.]|nr:DUF1015 domain-containing protein [Micropruina sp.]
MASLGVVIPSVKLPRPGTDLSRWAVVACDQFTSQETYWQEAAVVVGDAPSTLTLLYPEVFLAEPEPELRIARINTTMQEYLDAGLFQTLADTLLLVRRVTGAGVARWGLMIGLDLEQYSWESDARTLIRSTEGTILERIPPRKAIRRHAPLELPHIVVLISDPLRQVIEPLAARAEADGWSEPVYDTELMLDGGRVTGWRVTDSDAVTGLAEALEVLRSGLDPADPLLFAIGDGNHSLATAKSCWDDLKATLGEAELAHHPARYALVELENIFDPGLTFEPIHRVLFGVSATDFEAELSQHCTAWSVQPSPGRDELIASLERSQAQAFGVVDSDGFRRYEVSGPVSSIAAGTVTTTIDALLAERPGEVDYIHGADVTAELGRLPGNLGLFLPSVSKQTFFETIVRDGVLPRKTFSLGEAADKRYYLEARQIS